MGCLILKDNPFCMFGKQLIISAQRIDELILFVFSKS